MTNLNLNKLSNEEKIQIIKKGYDKTIEFAEKRKYEMIAKYPSNKSKVQEIEALYNANVNAFDKSSQRLTGATLDPEVKGATIFDVLNACTISTKDFYESKRESEKTKDDIMALAIYCTSSLEIVINCYEYIMESNKYDFSIDVVLGSVLAKNTKDYIVEDSCELAAKYAVEQDITLEDIRNALKEEGIDIEEILDVTNQDVEEVIKAKGKPAKVVEVEINGADIANRETLNNILKDVVKKAVKEERDKNSKRKPNPTVREAVRSEIKKTREEGFREDKSFGDKLVRAYKNNVTNVKNKVMN